MNHSISLKIFLLSEVLLITALLAFYIYQVNVETFERYLVQEYQKKISELSKENKILEINSAQLSSLDNITLLLQELSFEKADKIHYIQVLETEVVAR